jgi:hypothetical protein
VEARPSPWAANEPPPGQARRLRRLVDKIRETQPYGQALFGKVKKRNGDRALLSFSAGKDALAAALALREHYEEVVPFYMYLVPGVTFVEESLDYYERKLFGRPVLRVPHPELSALDQDAPVLGPGEGGHRRRAGDPAAELHGPGSDGPAGRGVGP